MLRSFVGKLGNDSVELLKVDVLVGAGLLADVSAVKHLQQLIIVDAVLNPLSDSFELLEINDAVLVLVVKGEKSLETVFSLSVSNSRANDLQKLVKGDWSVLVSESVDKRKNEGISLIESEFFKNFVDFFWVNGSTSVFVEDSKGLLEFVVVFFGYSIFPRSRFGCGCGGSAGCGFRSAHWIEIK